jgi:uncharacterized protein (DUF1499 family)
MKSNFIIGFTLSGLMALGSCSAKNNLSLGLENGELKKCPSSPNCVSSFEKDSSHSIEPLLYSTTKNEAAGKLKSLVLGMKRTTLINKTDDYMHFEFRSKIFRFVDDVEFYFPDNKKIIHIRSASRTGYSDMGVNRKRIEKIRTLFSE